MLPLLIVGVAHSLNSQSQGCIEFCLDPKTPLALATSSCLPFIGLKSTSCKIKTVTIYLTCALHFPTFAYTPFIGQKGHNPMNSQQLRYVFLLYLVPSHFMSFCSYNCPILQPFIYTQSTYLFVCTRHIMTIVFVEMMPI